MMLVSTRCKGIERAERVSSGVWRLAAGHMCWGVVMRCRNELRAVYMAVECKLTAAYEIKLSKEQPQGTMYGS